MRSIWPKIQGGGGGGSAQPTCHHRPDVLAAGPEAAANSGSRLTRTVWLGNRYDLILTAMDLPSFGNRWDHWPRIPIRASTPRAPNSRRPGACSIEGSTVDRRHIV
jgi:hypothetical protein